MIIFIWLTFIAAANSNSVEKYTSFVAGLQSDPTYPDYIEAYHSYEHAHELISNTVQKYPGRVTPRVIGYTVGKNPIWAFYIKSPKKDPQRRILLFAGLHAMEWMGMEVALTVINELAEHPPQGVEVIVVPWVNIDKRLLVESDRIQGTPKYRRSNLSGVDLNRDYEINREATALWRHIFPLRYESSPAPLSQPETRAIEHVLSTTKIDSAISLHSFGGYLYYPWAGLYKRAPDREEFVRLGQVMQKAQKGPFPYRVEQLSHWLFLFRIQGSELDHLYGKYNIHAFLIELTYTGVRLRDPSTWRDNFYLYNPKNPNRDKERGVDAVMALSREYSKQAMLLDKPNTN
jgi:hypothetical protein